MNNNNPPEEPVCSLCQKPMKEHQHTVTLGSCKHRYHLKCYDSFRWSNQATCHLCKDKDLMELSSDKNERETLPMNGVVKKTEEYSGQLSLHRLDLGDLRSISEGINRRLGLNANLQNSGIIAKTSDPNQVTIPPLLINKSKTLFAKMRTPSERESITQRMQTFLKDATAVSIEANKQDAKMSSRGLDYWLEQKAGVDYLAKQNVNADILLQRGVQLGLLLGYGYNSDDLIAFGYDWPKLIRSSFTCLIWKKYKGQISVKTLVGNLQITIQDVYRDVCRSSIEDLLSLGLSVQDLMLLNANAASLIDMGMKKQHLVTHLSHIDIVDWKERLGMTGMHLGISLEVTPEFLLNNLQWISASTQDAPAKVDQFRSLFPDYYKLNKFPHPEDIIPTTTRKSYKLSHFADTS